MTPDQITETYEVLAPMSTDYANANLERAGQAQASYGPLAEAAMGGSRTAGVGNYTYNRLVRPAVDTMRDQLIVEGYSAALNKQLSDSLNAAKNNYNRAARKSGGGGGTTGEGDGEGWDGEIDREGSQWVNVGDTYSITDSEGNTQTFRRPDIMNDYQWYQWGENQRKQAEANGKTFKWNS